MTNQFSVRVVVVAGVFVGVAVDHRLRLGKHGGGDSVKAVLLSARYVISDDGNIYAHLHAVLGCFAGTDVVTPSHGAGRPVMTIENGGEDAWCERGFYVARMLKLAGWVRLIKGSWDLRGRRATV